MANLLAAIGSAVDRNALESKSPQQFGQYAQTMRKTLGDKKFAPWADRMRQQVVARRNPALSAAPAQKKVAMGGAMNKALVKKM